MLGVVKQFFSPDSWALKRETVDFDRERLDRLSVGSAVEFGFMPQLALSAKRFKITGVRTYSFDGDKLISFGMSHGLDHHVNLIVAEAEEERYLCISRMISVDEALKLFSAENLGEVMEKLDNDRLFCKEGVVGFLGWTATSYRKTINRFHGAVCDGDYRDFPLPEESDLVTPFEYTLYVSDSEEYAIEIEEYQDGRVDMYATIYRRSTDIARVFPPVKMHGEMSEERNNGNNMIQEPLFMRAIPDEPVKEAEILIEEYREPQHDFMSVPHGADDPLDFIEVEAEAPKKESTPAPLSGFFQLEPTNLATLQNTHIEIEPAKEPARQPERQDRKNKSSRKAAAAIPASVAAPEAPPHLLECDMHVAGKIIDEALRNQMSLSELIRRVLGLQLQTRDQVYIPLDLSEEDFKQLAERYGLDASNKDELRRQIAEELNSFAGENA